jgi:hypothetical protein
MTVPQSAPQAVGAVLAALERYRLHVGQLTGPLVNPELYRTVSQDLDEVRRCCQPLPALSSGWIALLIAHAELMHSLWQATRPAGPGKPERSKLLARVHENVDALQADCMRLQGAG